MALEQDLCIVKRWDGRLKTTHGGAVLKKTAQLAADGVDVQT
jgi:hypothetical protein